MTKEQLEGLGKREYLAAMAMQGLVSNEFIMRDKTDEGIAIRAMSIADELLKAFAQAKELKK